MKQNDEEEKGNEMERLLRKVEEPGSPKGFINAQLFEN